MLIRIRKSEYLRNITTLTSGNAVAQAIPVLISPVLSRIYTPEDFGLFAFYMSVVSVCALIATLRYELAIIFPKKDEDAVNLFGLSMLIDLFFSIFLLVIIVILEFLLFPHLSLDHILKTWFYFLPLMVLMIGSGNVFQNWFNRKKKYRLLAFARVVNSIGNNGLILILGIIGLGAWGLLLGSMTGLVLFNIFFIYGIYFRDKLNLNQINKNSIRSLARQFSDLPKANAPQSLVESFQLNGIIYLLKAFFTATVVGWYSFAMRVLQAPMWLIGTSIAQVFYKEASVNLQEEGSIRGSVIKTLKLTSLIGLPVLIILLLAGPWLFGFVFGQDWREAGIIARILAPWIYVDFIRYSIAQAPILVKRLKTMFAFAVAGTFMVFITLFVGGYVLKDYKLAFIILSTGMVIFNLVVIRWIFSISKNVINDKQ